MVSWFRFYADYWQVFYAQHAPDGQTLATAAHKAFLTVVDSEDLWQWFQDHGKVPGVVLLARNKVGKDGKRKIDVMHHLRLIQRSDEEGDDYVVGILQLGGGSQMGGLLVKDMTANLVPTTGKRAGTRGGASGSKDATIYVPSLDSLLDKHDGPFGKTYTPKVGEEAITSEDLAERPSVIFVPFDLWAVVCKGVNLNRTTEDDKRQEETAEEVGTVEDVGEVEEEKPSMEETSVPEGEDEIGTDKANSPLDLARRLSEMMSILKGDDPEMFKVYRMVAQNLIDFLWAANNNLTTGIRIRSIEGDLEVMRHTRECIHDFLTFAEEGSLPGWNVQPETVPDQEHDEPQPPVFDQDQESVTLVEGQPQQPTVTMEDARNERPVTLPPPPQGETTRPPGNPPAITAGQDDGPPVWVKSFMTGLAGTMADVGLAIREAVQVNRSSKEKEEEKKKATSKWLPDALFVLKVLSAENGWDTPGVPELSPFALKLFEMKILQAIQFVRAKAKDESWSGCILKSGLSEFLKRGPIAEDINEAPSGFSVLFFHHSAYSEGDDESHSTQALREAYGDGEMPEDLIKAFSKLHIFAPTCSFRAGEQIRTAIQFLEVICGAKTIATSGYRHGLKVLEEHRRLFERESEKDKMFLFNYLYLLDRVFQRFCREIRECNQEDDPVLALKEMIRGDRWMKEMINQALEPLLIYGKELGLRPPIKLQERSHLSGLIDMSQLGKGGAYKRPAENQEGGAKAVGRMAKRRVAGGEAYPDWWFELTPAECVKEWAIPQGKKFGDYFGPHKKDNVVGLPYVQHHKTKRPAPICLKYQLGNNVKCKRGADCALAHIRPRDLSSDDYQQISEHLRKVFLMEAGGQS